MMTKLLLVFATAAVLGAGLVTSQYYDNEQGYGETPQYYSQPSYDQAHWGYWGEYSECSEECGGGEQTRTRDCMRPRYSGYGNRHGYRQPASCYGDSSETRECNSAPCPVDGAWSDWGDYSECSNQCGYGEKTRERTCTEPEPSNGGRDCYGPSEQSTYCHEYKCPVDGEWTYWSAYSYCSVSCGGGEKTRQRSCTYPAPRYGGAECEGNFTQSMTCNEYPCRVNGAWSDWGDYSECSNRCGYGEKNRERTCTEPEPSNGGRDCYGPSQQSTYCHEYKCPVDGGWAYWGDYSRCSAECGGGEQTRERTCTKPAPENGGADCEGDGEEMKACNEDPCPVDGMWSEWSDYSDCSVSCAGGEQTRSRTCTEPEPAYGGADCEGESEEMDVCNEDPCPVDGMWGEWAYWTECSGECGEGQRSRTRECDSPEPAYEGDDCEGDDSESEKCKLYNPCHPHGY